jgi:hypothetical protein
VTGGEPARATLDDDALLTVLAHVLAVEEPFSIDVLVALEREAFAMRRVDDELAELLFDTGIEQATVLRGDGPRALSFVADGVVLDVELQPDGTLSGRIAPADVEVTVEGAAGVAELQPDHLGRFTAAAPAGRLRFVLRSAAHARRILTPWIFR